MVRTALLWGRALALSIAFGAASTAAQADVDSPSDRIAALNDALLSAMQNADAIGYDGRFALLEPTVTDVFYFPGMLVAAVGGEAVWNGFSDQEKSDLLAAFERMSIGSYAARFDGYSGEQFTIAGVQESASGVRVRTILVLGSGDSVTLDYVMIDIDDAWHVVDVMLDGRVSELARQRSEYISVLDSIGVAGLIERLGETTLRLQSNSD